MAANQHLSLGYIKQLDAIRAFAVVLVIITHWFPVEYSINFYTSVFNGVDIFFVLSGFLITRILLENRNESEIQGTRKGNVVKSFFVRRVLRIFPIYYLTIFVLFIIGPATESDIRNNFVYFFTYTSNFYFFSIQGWDGMLSHLWSLSVEEQFYLLWPWLMLYPNKKTLLPIILCSIFIGIAAQLYLMDVMLGDILTVACLDGFGLGALLAWVSVYKPALLKKTYPIWVILAIISCALQILRVASHSSYVVLPSRTLTALCTIWMIIAIILYREKKSLFFNGLLNNEILVFIGKISYGIYLYHLILPYCTASALVYLNSFLPAGIRAYNFYLIRLENFFILIALSYLSWKLIEQPILRYKKRFTYQDEPVQALRKVKVLAK